MFFFPAFVFVLLCFSLISFLLFSFFLLLFLLFLFFFFFLRLVFLFFGVFSVFVFCFSLFRSSPPPLLPLLLLLLLLPPSSLPPLPLPSLTFSFHWLLKVMGNCFIYLFFLFRPKKARVSRFPQNRISKNCLQTIKDARKSSKVRPSIPRRWQSKIVRSAVSSNAD